MIHSRAKRPNHHRKVGIVMTASEFYGALQGKRVSFIGVGRTNLPLIEKFLAHGARVSVRDKREAEALGADGEYLRKLGAALICGENYLRNIDEDMLFRTPGVPYLLPELQAAKARGTAVTSEMEVFFDLCPCKIYAVTGSDGKTTTTSVIAEMLRAAGRTVHLGGNIGRPLLPEIEEIRPEDVAVVELSSFQLISMRRSPDVAVVTNLSPNHLDVHKDMDEYVNAKKNIFLHQNAFQRTVLNADNALTAACAAEARGETLLFSRREKTNGAWCGADGEIRFGSTFVMREEDIRIPGKHNVENYLAAVSAVWGNVPAEIIASVARNFNGVEHRMEFVRELQGVRWYNDSIATSPSRVMTGTLSLYDFKIIMIAGGADKKVPFDELGGVICDKVKTLILLSPEAPLPGFKPAAAGKIEAAVLAAPNYKDGAPEIISVHTMEDAVAAARSRAQAGDVVSLCPAATGFDMYKSFAERGDAFRAIVQGLK